MLGSVRQGVSEDEGGGRKWGREKGEGEVTHSAAEEELLITEKGASGAVPGKGSHPGSKGRNTWGGWGGFFNKKR